MNSVEIHDSGLTVGAAVPLAQIVGLERLPIALRESLANARKLKPNDALTVGDCLRDGAQSHFHALMVTLAALDVAIETYDPVTNSALWLNVDHFFESAMSRQNITGLFVPYLSANQALELCANDVGCACAFVEADLNGLPSIVFVANMTSESRAPVGCRLNALEGVVWADSMLQHAVEALPAGHAGDCVFIALSHCHLRLQPT